MQRELDTQGLQLSPYCIQQLELLVTRGIERMRNNKVLDHAGHILNAERNLKSLVKYIGGYSREEGTFPKLTNTGFDAAILASPTFWPYSISG